MFEIDLETIMTPDKMIGKAIEDYEIKSYIAYDGENNAELYDVLIDGKLELAVVVDGIIVNPSEL